MATGTQGRSSVRGLKPVQDGRITVKTRNGAFLIPVGDVWYAESFGRKVVLHLKDRKIEYYARIGELERQLGGDFFRVHRSFLIRMDMVQHFTRADITLKNGSVVWLSKYKYADFVKAYAAYGKRRRAG